MKKLERSVITLAFATSLAVGFPERYTLVSGSTRRPASAEPLWSAADVWVTRRVRDALLDRLRLKPYWRDLHYEHYLPLQSAIL